MHKSYPGQHIYTFVVGKKSSAVCTVAFFGVITLIACLGIFSDSPNFYSQIYNLCHTRFSGSDRMPLKELTLDALKPDIRTVMQTATPMLHRSDTVRSDSQPASASDAAAKKQDSPEKRVLAEKNIKSENMSFKNETSYSFDLHQLSSKQTSYVATGQEPRVLILHTHACEAYSDENGVGIGEGGTYRSTDNSKNMVNVGQKLTDNLRKSGINVIHDTTQCDYPYYNNAYKNSLSVADWYLNTYPSINFIFDIHRDAIADEANAPVKLTCDINGVKTAQIMIVCGTDAMGLSHPNWTENLTLASKIQSYLEKSYPGIVRPLNIRRERFNMHTTPGSLIFEIGTHGNTMEEALRSIDILSKALENVLLNKEQ